MLVTHDIFTLTILLVAAVCFLLKEAGSKVFSPRLSDKESLEIIFGKKEQKTVIPDVAVPVRFSDDNTCYLVGDGKPLLVTRFSRNNTIFDCYATAEGFRSSIRNQRMGREDVVKAGTEEEMIELIEKRFRQWAVDDPGILHG